jgi:AcrR family transcriptional regulator
MPKIIKDVEDIIKNQARSLFIDHGYEQVDMKMISQKCEIAVGTLYNYYENKKQLYTLLLEESWQDTFYKLDVINEFSISSEEKIINFITALYEDIESRNGLGKALVGSGAQELQRDEKVINLKRNLILRVQNLINYCNTINDLNKFNNIDNRLAESMLTVTLTMLELYPRDKEKNIYFLTKFLSKMIY